MDSAILPAGNTNGELEAQRKDYTRALVSEIRLLLRTVSNDPLKRATNLKLTYKLPGEPSLRELTSPEIIDAVSEIESQIDHHSGIGHIGFLQLVRDTLVSMTAPATGLTIAYTALVAGEQRSQSAESGFALARKAYGLLTNRAIWHRYLAFLLTAVAIAITFFAAWEATRASLGKSLLQNLDLLRTQQTAIAAEKLKLETSLDRRAGDGDFNIAADGRVPLYAVPLCNRYQLRSAAMANGPGIPKGVRLEGSPAERELCGRDTVLARNIEIVHASLQQYKDFWPDSVGGIVGATGRLLSHVHLFDQTKSGPTCAAIAKAPTPGDTTTEDPDTKSPACHDVEFMIAPMLQITTNYVLPLTFGFVGSLLYVLLEHFTKLRTNALSPRDLPLMMLRLVIGLVVAACVSLLVSASASPGPAVTGSMTGAPAAGALVASLTLSASGITFLAGFGAEAVVTLLQSLVTRLFATPK